MDSTLTGIVTVIIIFLMLYRGKVMIFSNSARKLMIACFLPSILVHVGILFIPKIPLYAHLVLAPFTIFFLYIIYIIIRNVDD